MVLHHTSGLQVHISMDILRVRLALAYGFGGRCSLRRRHLHSRPVAGIRPMELTDPTLHPVQVQQVDFRCVYLDLLGAVHL